LNLQKYRASFPASKNKHWEGSAMTDTDYISTPLPTRPVHHIPPLGQEPREANSHTPSRPQDNNMNVGPGIELKGEISNCATLIVEGHVQAKLDGDALEINQRGVFSGTARVASAFIHGRFEGDLIVSGLLRVTNGGSVTGKVRYGQLDIAEGADVSGEIRKYTDEDEKPSEQPILKWPSSSTNVRLQG
jgi:cytoskeletal protein CcmA (bactofilin family)